MTTTSKKTTKGHGFKTGEAVVYPTHGVGRIKSIEVQEVAGFKLELFVIFFEKDKMTLRVPVSKAPSVGMRKLSETAIITKALETVTGRAPAATGGYPAIVILEPVGGGPQPAQTSTPSMERKKSP